MIRTTNLCKILSFVLGSLCLTSYANESITLKVALIAPERPPYFFVSKEGQSPSGLYIDILEKITQNLPVKLEYHFLPQARIRMYMENGSVDIEPGIDSSWRTSPNEVKQSFYTIPFMHSYEAYAYLGGKKDNINTSKGVVCGINGFNIPENFNRSNTQLVTTEFQLLSMIVKKRCDFAVAPIDVINYWNTKNNSKINYGDVISRYQLRFRLNKRHQNILQTLNNNIRALQAGKELETMKRKYIPQSG